MLPTLRRAIDADASLTRDIATLAPVSGRRRRNRLVGEPAGTGIPAEPVQLDEIDRRIIAILQADGRRSYSSISAEIEINEATVRYRVQRLLDTQLLQIVGIADPLRLGFGMMAMVGISVKPGAIEEVCERLVELHETSYVVVTTGRFDILAEVVCRDIAAFTHLLTERIHAIEGVLGAESFVLLEIHKLAYGWGVGEVEVAPNRRTAHTVDRRRRTQGTTGADRDGVG